jgi:hypothetical protein
MRSRRRSAARPLRRPSLSSSDASCPTTVHAKQTLCLAESPRPTYTSPPARLATWSTCSSSRPTSPKPCKFVGAGMGQPPIGLVPRPASRSSEGRHRRRTPPGASLGLANCEACRVVYPSVDPAVSPEAPLFVGGVYEQRRAAGRIVGPAFIRREVSRPRSVVPRISPVARPTPGPENRSPCKRIEGSNPSLSALRHRGNLETAPMRAVSTSAPLSTGGLWVELGGHAVQRRWFR